MATMDQMQNKRAQFWARGLNISHLPTTHFAVKVLECTANSNCHSCANYLEGSQGTYDDTPRLFSGGMSALFVLSDAGQPDSIADGAATSPLMSTTGQKQTDSASPVLVSAPPIPSYRFRSL
jgi:hypothetical protein